jgi:hypothetical protein
MDFYKVKNNTSNPLIINGTYIDSNSYVVIGDYFLEKIDFKYFEAEILVNEGLVEVGEPIHVDPPKNITTIVRERNLESSIRETLLRANEAYNVVQNKIGYDDLKPSIRKIIDSVSDTTFKTYWKDFVEDESLLPSSDFNINSNGDVRLVLNTNSFYRWNSSENRWVKIATASNSPSQGNGQAGAPISIIKERFILDEFFANPGQNIFNLRGKYAINTNDLQVILNGILLTKDEDYIEIDEQTVEVLFPLEFQDYVVFSISGQDTIPYIVVEKHIVVEKKNEVLLNNAIGNNPSTVQVFLNGIAVSFGEQHDYLVEENKKLAFNYDLEVGDVVLVRFEQSSMAENFENKFAQMQRIYMDLSLKVQYLREVVENKP